MNKQIALSIEQMQKLQELGLDCSGASMSWVVYKDITDEWVEEELPLRSHFKHDEESAPIICLKLGYSKGALYSDMSDCSNYSCCEVVPAFCLQDILELLPEDISLAKCYDDFWQCIYNESGEDANLNGYVLREGKTALEVSYNMLCWCIDNNYIKTK